MSLVTIFSSVFCHKEPIVEEILARTSYRRVTDDDLTDLASQLSGIDQKKISAAFASKTSMFNKFTHEREHAIAWLRLAAAKTIMDDQILIDGFCAQLIPKTISHALRVCLIANVKFRLNCAEEEEGISKKDAMHRIRKADEKRSAWTSDLFRTRDPWDSSFYDITIPTDRTDVATSVQLIEDNLKSEVIRPTEKSRQQVKDFVLAAEVGVALANHGNNIDVSASDGAVTIEINKNVLRLHRLEEELKSAAEKVEGVKSVETSIGKEFHQADIYRKYDFDAPKILLVDDERKFIHSLSERLRIRDVNSAVAYDGESALAMLDEDETEVMILDLRMPGIDGIEVLKKVKQTRPEIEVIILTGHGSEDDKELCMSLGAFAFLQKPVKIEVLTETLKRANEKIERNKASKDADAE